MRTIAMPQPNREILSTLLIFQSAVLLEVYKSMKMHLSELHLEKSSFLSLWY